MRNPVCYVGVDGSGKTTLALRIVRRLRENGFRVRYLWFRQPHFLSLPFLAFCRVVGLTRVRRRGDLVWKDHNFKSEAASTAWVLLQFLDTLISAIVKIRLPIALGYVMVCDRFIHDILVDLMIDTSDHELSNKRLGRLLLQMAPENTVVFLVDVPEEVALRRKRDIPSIDYLGARRHLYLKLAESLNIKVLQGAETQDVRRILETTGQGPRPRSSHQG